MRSWFGGKSRAAGLIWSRLGNVEHYIEPFGGSLAVLLARPIIGKMETVNDLDCLLVNFWRAMQREPAEVARHADCPVTEADLHARHLWLVNNGRALVEQCMHDPCFYDARTAGWWLWGICAWIGGYFGQPQGAFVPPDGVAGIPHYEHKVWKILPYLTSTGQGIHRGLDRSASGDETAAAMASDRRGYLIALAEELCNRLRHVRITAGDWKRVVGPGGFHHPPIGIVLDPPYDTDDAECKQGIYGVETAPVAAEVRQWAIANGSNLNLRIALCGYAGEHAMPADWEEVAWEAQGGYGNRTKAGRGRSNAKRERIYFSPGCLRPDAPRQFSLMDAIAASKE